MKTIDKNKIKEAANNYVVSNFLEECTMKQYIIDSFETGFELCEQVFKEKLRWIPVEEKLPETYSKILATIKSPECIWVEEIGFGEGKFQLPGRGDTNFVTHWMYVPEPPSFL